MYCFLNMIVRRKILCKDLAGLVNPSLPLAGNRYFKQDCIVHFVYLHCSARAAFQPFQTQPLCLLIAHNMQ
jgi:hypothetical protein